MRTAGAGGKVKSFRRRRPPIVMTRRSIDDRRLSAIGLTRLLSRLDPDARRAAAEYERLRRTLLRFFDLRGAWAPEECVDDSLDRLARRLESEQQDEAGGPDQQGEQGEPPIADVWRYAHGIARLVLLERLRTPAPASIQDQDLANVAGPASTGDGDPLQECFDSCLDAQPAAHRALALQYYLAEGQAKIDNRRGLARTLGITENALRRRVQRIREQLARCTQHCTAAAVTLGVDVAARNVLAARGTLQGDDADGA
jgi:DNA-directed RNA polymerase specialized sigma24 family protein